MKFAGKIPALSLFSALVMIVAVIFTATPQPTDAAGPLYRSTYPSKITYKLGSGIGNVLFCWAEFPLEINEEIQNTDPFTGSIIGFFKGFYYTCQRLVLGVVDIVTFPIDVYGNNYQSIQRTEFPFMDEVD